MVAAMKRVRGVLDQRLQRKLVRDITTSKGLFAAVTAVIFLGCVRGQVPECLPSEPESHAHVEGGSFFAPDHGQRESTPRVQEGEPHSSAEPGMPSAG